MDQRFDNMWNGVEQKNHLTKNSEVYKQHCMIGLSIICRADMKKSCRQVLSSWEASR